MKSIDALNRTATLCMTLRSLLLAEQMQAYRDGDIASFRALGELEETLDNFVEDFLEGWLAARIGVPVAPIYRQQGAAHA